MPKLIITNLLKANYKERSPQNNKPITSYRIKIPQIGIKDNINCSKKVTSHSI